MMSETDYEIPPTNLQTETRYLHGQHQMLNPNSIYYYKDAIGGVLRSRERMGKDFKKQLVFEAKELNYTSVDEDFLQRAIDCVHRHLDDPDFDQAKLWANCLLPWRFRLPSTG